MCIRDRQYTIVTYPLQDEAGRPTSLSPYYDEIFTGDDPWAEKVVFFKRPLSAIPVSYTHLS